MKLRHLLPALALAAPFAVNAVPAYPGLITMSNPDGTKITLRMHGDESFSYATDAEGVNIYERNASGYWVKATLNGAELLNVPADVERLREASYPAGARYASRPKTVEVGDDGRSVFPTTGEEHFLVVLIQYADIKFSMSDPQAFYTRWCNEENFEHQDLKGSVRDYYTKSSNGLFKPYFDVTEVVTLPNNSAYYTGGSKTALFYEAAKYALDMVDATVDFTKYDIDNDGKIDNVYFLYAGYEQSDTFNSDYMWPHKDNLSSYGYRYDGKLMTTYACGGELRGSSHYEQKDMALCGIGTFCHEFGHVLGLPDLYVTSGSADTVVPGEWSVMCSGSYTDDGRTPPENSAYEKWVCHWIEYEDAVEDKHYDLKSLVSEPRGVKISIPAANGGVLANEYYVLESRTKEGWDSGLPNEGLLVWHIDFQKTAWTNNTVNNNASRPRCSIVLPPGSALNEASWPAAGFAGSFIAPGYDSALTPFGNYDKEAFSPFVTAITYDAENNVSGFDYATALSEYTEVPTFKEFWKREGYDTDDSKTGFVIRWNKCPGAVNYLLTVKRYTSAGTAITVDDLTDKNIGDVDEYVIEETASAMKRKHVVTLRAVGSTPSTDAATMEVVPLDLNSYGGSDSVASIEDNAEIYGVVGAVVAPEGARVFDLRGVEMVNKNLAAGIYFVRYGSTTVKVIVK
jgi:M6 family metalloprotease-like protein